jgi:serine phosphatase RsbU (regulator of sigma subunit)
MREPILVLDAALRIRLVNRSFYDAFPVAPGDAAACRIHELTAGPCAGNHGIAAWLDHVFSTGHSLEDYRIPQASEDGIGRCLLLNARKWTLPTPEPAELLLLTFSDVATRYPDVEMTAPFRALQRAYDRERRIAEVFERPLMQEIPQNTFPGLSLATVYEAASEEADVGGDFFDAFALPRGLVALAVADASGKGLEAAVRTLQVKNVLRAFSREYPYCPNQIMSRLNDFVCDTLRYDDGEEGYYFGGFVCLTLAIIDPHTGEGNILSAGCEPPAILRQDGTVSTIRSHGLPLGIQRETLYQMTPLHLNSGDALLFSTDGVTEARRQRTREFLGYSGMLALAEKHRKDACVRCMALGILDGARDFADGVLRDDACLLIARKHD